MFVSIELELMLINIDAFASVYAYCCDAQLITKTRVKILLVQAPNVVGGDNLGDKIQQISQNSQMKSVNFSESDVCFYGQSLGLWQVKSTFTQNC